MHLGASNMHFKIKEQFREKLFIAFRGISEDLFECRSERASKRADVLQELTKPSGFIELSSSWIY